MPENKDTQYTTDSGRSGGRQTTGPDRDDRANWSQKRRSEFDNADLRPGYGSDAGQQPGTGAAAPLTPDGSPESGGPEGQFAPEEKRRAMSVDSNRQETNEIWSPGGEQPKS